MSVLRSIDTSSTHGHGTAQFDYTTNGTIAAFEQLQNVIRGYVGVLTVALNHETAFKPLAFSFLLTFFNGMFRC